MVDGRLPTDGSCISVPSGSGSNASNAYFTLTGGCPPPPVCTAGAPGCFTERIFAHSDCSGSSETEVLVLADGRCNPAIVDGQVVNFYEIECQDGNLVGKGGCDSSCNNCIAPVVTMATDGSCNSLSLIDGTSVNIQLRGQCYVCTPGSPGCITENVFTDHTCGTPAFASIQLLADGNCNGIVLPDGSTPNYYQLTCEDGFATGRGRLVLALRVV